MRLEIQIISNYLVEIEKIFNKVLLFFFILVIISFFIILSPDLFSKIFTSIFFFICIVILQYYISSIKIIFSTLNDIILQYQIKNVIPSFIIERILIINIWIYRIYFSILILVTIIFIKIIIDIIK